MRHNFAAHYYQPKELLKGYRNFFFDRSPDEFNTRALVSFGDEVKGTRFYFADAAVQMAQSLIDPSDARVKEVDVYTLCMFRGLRFLIEEYLNLKNEAREGGPSPA